MVGRFIALELAGLCNRLLKRKQLTVSVGDNLSEPIAHGKLLAFDGGLGKNSWNVVKGVRLCFVWFLD